MLLSKMVLVSPTADEYELLRKQLLERLESGNGEIIYDIGQGEGETFIYFYLSCYFVR